MKHLLLLGTVLLSSLSFSQIQFNELLPIDPTPTNFSDFIGVKDGSITYADGDDDLDVFIPGKILHSKNNVNDSNLNI